MDPTDDLFDFSSFDDGKLDIGDMFGNPPVNNDAGWYSQDRDPPEEPNAAVAFETIEPNEEPSDPSLAESTTQAASISPISAEIDGTAEDFSGIEPNTEAAGHAPQIVQLAPQAMDQHNYNDEVRLVCDSQLPAVPDWTMSTVMSKGAFDITAVYPHDPPLFDPSFPILNVSQQTQWHTSASQYSTVRGQAQPAFVQSQQLQVAETRFDPGFQLPNQLPSGEYSDLTAHFSPRLQPAPQYQLAQTYPLPQNTHQAQSSPQEQDILSNQQILMLHNATPAERAQSQRRNTSHQAIRRSNLPPSDSSSSEEDEDELLKKAPRSKKRKAKRPTRTTRPVRQTSTPMDKSQHHGPPQTVLSGLTFASFRDAQEAMTTRFINSDWNPPSPDNTIPTTQNQRSEYVLMMYEAFQDASECKDNRNGFSFLKRWDETEYYNLREMEKVCWHMLDIAERLHAHGPTASNIYCEDALKKLKASRNLTFEQRIHAICAMLRFSKALCDNLMKGEGIEALVGAPKQKMSGAKTMMVQNLKRQKWIVHGRNEDQANLDAMAEANVDEIPEPNTRKGRKKSKHPGPAANSRTKKAPPQAVPEEEADGEGDVVGLERRQSEFSLRRRSSYLTDAEQSPSNTAESNSSKTSSTPRKSSTSHLRGSPSTAASAPSLRQLTKSKTPKPASSPQLRIPPAQIEAAHARFAEQHKVETKTDAEVHTAMEAQAAARKRAIELTDSDSEADQPRPSKKLRANVPHRKYTLSDHEMDVDGPDAGSSNNEADEPDDDWEDALDAEDADGTDERSSDSFHDIDEAITDAKDEEDKAEAEEEADEKEADEKVENKDVEDEEDNDHEVESDSEDEDEEDDSEPYQPEPLSPSPPCSPTRKRKIENVSKRAAISKTRPLLTTVKPSAKSAKKMTRITQHGLIDSTPENSTKRKGPILGDAESENGEESVPAKRARKIEALNTRKSARITAQQNSGPANNDRIKKGKMSRNA